MAQVFQQPKWVALEARLKSFPEVITLGVRPNFMDYNDRERALILGTDKVYYPSAFYAELMDTLGKYTFPSYHTYKFAQDKIKQTALFAMAGIPHPRTRIFYGKRQKASIRNHYDLPLIAKIPRGSSLGRGVFLIQSQNELDNYCQMPGPAYIQEYLPIDRDIRVVVIGYQVVLAYWRIAKHGEYRSNVARGGQIDFSPVPQQALDMARHTAATCQWDDVGIDICEHQGQCYVLEANMKYGREGFRQAGMDYYGVIEQFIRQGVI